MLRNNVIFLLRKRSTADEIFSYLCFLCFLCVSLGCRDGFSNLSIFHQSFFPLFLWHWSSGHNQYAGLSIPGSILWAAYGSIFAQGSHANYYLLPCKLITQIRCLLNLNNVYRIKQRKKRWKMIPGCLWRDAEVKHTTVYVNFCHGWGWNRFNKWKKAACMYSNTACNC